MGRHGRDQSWGPRLVELIGLVFLLSLFSPQVRQFLLVFGVATFSVLAFIALGLVCFGIYRLATRRASPESRGKTGH